MEHRKTLNVSSDANDSNDTNSLKIVYHLLNVLQKLMEQQWMMQRI